MQTKSRNYLNTEEFWLLSGINVTYNNKLASVIDLQTLSNIDTFTLFLNDGSIIEEVPVIDCGPPYQKGA